MGKYDGVIKKLPRDAPGGEPKFREKVEARKRELVELETKLSGALKPAAIAQKYAAARRESDRVAERETEVSLEVRALEELMQTVFEAEDLSSLKLGDGTSISVAPEPTATVLDHEKMITWIKANGYERMLTLYAATIGAIAKELLLQGDALTTDEDGNMTVMNGAVRIGSRMKTTMRK